MRAFWLAMLLGFVTLGCGAPVAERPPATSTIDPPLLMQDAFDSVETTMFPVGAFPYWASAIHDRSMQ